MWRRKLYYVYILASHRRTLYVGASSLLHSRVMKHKECSDSKFVQKYKCHSLVYYQAFDNSRAAITREKQIKSWRREKKVVMIEAYNPDWKDLTTELDGITD